MTRYSIKDIEQITGIKAHTIRIWERRYSIIQPRRTKTNIRYYSDADLKRLLNISMLNSSGIKISKLAQMENIDIETKVIELSRTNRAEEISIEKLILATLNFDEDLFESTLSRCILNHGMESATSEVLFPFFERIGVLWQVGSISPAQEHFVSNLIRQKLFSAIDSVSTANIENAKKIIFFLKEKELHENSMLFFNYIARKNGFKTLYLGQDLPFSDLSKVVEFYKPDILITSFITYIESEKLNQYLAKLQATFTSQKIFISGLQLHQNKIIIPEQISIIKSAPEFKQQLSKLK